MKSDLIDPAELDAYDAWVAEHLDEMVRQHPGKVLAVYRGRLIAVGDTYREVFEATKIAFPVLRSPSRDFLEIWKVRRAPMTIRIGPGGTVQDVEVGIEDPIRLGEIFRP